MMLHGKLVLASVLGIAVGAFAPTQTQAAAATNEPGLSAKQLDLIGDAFKLHMAAGQMSGGIVLVARHGKTVRVEARGAASPNERPFAPDSIFPIASLTKPVIAVAIMMLVEEGKISLEDPLSKYIPEFSDPRPVRVLEPGSPPPLFTATPGSAPIGNFGTPRYRMEPASRPVTIRHLLTHTSGIQAFGAVVEQPQMNPAANTLATRLPLLAAVPLEFDPGSRWRYSNLYGYDLLGRIVEVASGQSLDAFLSRRIFEPLAMADTGFGVVEASHKRAAGNFAPNMPPPVPGKVSYFNASFGLWSTVADYARFLHMLADGGVANGRRFLKSETVTAMTSNQIGPLLLEDYPPMRLHPRGLTYGYGVLVVTNPAAAGTQMTSGSYGWDGGGSRRAWVDPKTGVVIVILATPMNAEYAPFHRDIESIVMSAVPPG